jgi:hypothetical protein
MSASFDDELPEAEIEEKSAEEEELEDAAEPVKTVDYTIQIPYFDLDIAQGSAPFDHLVLIVRGMRQSKNLEVKRICSEYYPKIVDAFEKKWGQIRASYISSSNAVVITDYGHLKHLEQTPDISSLELIHECDKLKIEAHRLLKETDNDGSKEKNRDLLSCMDMVYEILTHLFSSMDRVIRGKINEKEHNKLVKYLSNEFIDIKEHFVKCAQRRALTEYYGGMLKGLGLILVIAVLTFFFGNFISLTIVTAFAGSLLAGGIGAIISVMQRMKSGVFNPDYEAGPGHNSRLGINRPIIGAVMGAVLYLLMMSGLLPLNIPENGSKHLYYVFSIAFTAGFTERWAQGMLPSGQSDENGGEEELGKEMDTEKPEEDKDSDEPKPDKPVKEPE